MALGDRVENHDTPSARGTSAKVSRVTNRATGPYGVEGFKVFRVAMVLSSLSPLFVLWAIRGNPVIPDSWLAAACLLLVILPTWFLYWRIKTTRASRDERQVTVGAYEDSRKHLLVYLFATLLPFYRTPSVDYRELAAMAVALGFIIFLFLHLRLHYVNILFALKGYRVFTVFPPRDGNPYTGKGSFVLISSRHHLDDGERIKVYRITDSVYMEALDAARF